jgi:hypothetical protein
MSPISNEDPVAGSVVSDLENEEFCPRLFYVWKANLSRMRPVLLFNSTAPFKPL